MSEEPTKSPQRLHWWFWLVLFTPSLVAILAPLTGFRLILPLLLAACALNFVCSNWAAKQIILLRDPHGGSSPWMFLWGPLLFFLNAALAFVGCEYAEQFSLWTRWNH